MKTIKLILIMLLLYTGANAQTFKITGLSASSDDFYNQCSRDVGAKIVVELFDKSARVKTFSNGSKGNDTYFLKEVADNKYKITGQKDDSANQTTILTLNKVVAYISSIELYFQIDEIGGKHRQVWVKYTARRE